MVFMLFKVVLALGKARLLLSRVSCGTSFATNTFVLEVDFKLFTVL